MTMPKLDSQATADPFLRDLIQQFPLAIAMLDKAGRPVMLNDRFERIYGREALDSEPMRALMREPASGWAKIEVPGPGRTAVEVKAQLLRFHGDPILIVDDTEDPALTQQLIELRAQVTELERRSVTDPLTGVWNRAHLNRVIALELDRSRRQRQPLSLILCDIDHFKRINDSHGHLVGDSVLRELVGVIATMTRSTDTLFRWGGEEFVVLTTSTGYRGAAKLAEKMRGTVERHGFAGTGVLTISVGVAEHITSEPMETWFSRADAALYRAKESGRNRVCIDRYGSSDIWAAESGPSVVRLIWQEAYECGEPTIDRDHRELFDLANDLLEASAKAKECPDLFGSALDKLLRHVAQHFANEEAVLARYAYPGLDAHKRAHAQLLTRAGELKASAEAGTAKFGDLVEFLANSVVAQHLFKADRAFFPLFDITRRQP